MLKRALNAAETSITAFVGSAARGASDKAVKIDSLAEFSECFGEVLDKYPLSHAVRQFFENGGRKAFVVRVANERFAEPSLSIRQQGLWALDQVDAFNLLAIPPLEPGKDIDVRSLGTALAYCKSRRAILLVDPRSKWSMPVSVLDPQGGIESLGLRDPNAVLYYPNILAASASNRGKSIACAPCGAIAGLIARTDASRGVWKAPAGVHAGILGAQGLERNVSTAENRLLNQAGINCLRSFAKTGIVSWGARTLDGADFLGSDWKYFPLRRVALMIEESLERGLNWVVFEPNDEPLWAEISEAVEDFMFQLFREGAFQGKTLNDSFFVRCDDTTNTEADIDRGVVNLQVGFAPLRPAEFTILNFQLKTASCSDDDRAR
ncbi:phage tail sheath family protein [Denitrobaculum tricleocarpae]|nr:phage tail sheath subtilisin-like domain-containing protein [Denitrobaculum tricleocarpae]